MDNFNVIEPQRPLIIDASICEVIYKQTNWTGTFFNFWRSQVGSAGQWVLTWYGNVETRELKERIPAYDISYVINKLPTTLTLDDEIFSLEIIYNQEDNEWTVQYVNLVTGNVASRLLENEDVIGYCSMSEKLESALGDFVLLLVKEGKISSGAA